MTDKQKLLVLNNLLKHYGPQHWWASDNRLEDWLTMILIQRTTGLNVEKAMVQLRPYLMVAELRQMPVEQLETLIKPAGFYHQKAGRIKSLLDWFVQEGSDFDVIAQRPFSELRQTLLSLNGIGPETADVMLMYIFHKKTFVADQYAMRVFNHLGFGPYKDYEKMKADFEPLLKNESYTTCCDWHAVIDEHGKVQRANHQADESWLLKEA